MTIAAPRGAASSAICLLLSLAAANVFAADSGDANDDVVVLSPFESRETNAAEPLYEPPGLAGDPAGVPRTVARIDADDLFERGVLRIEDLAQFVPGATNATLYGIAGVPTIRGDLGDIAQNGQRRSFNRNAFPVSFNAVEAADVAAGAAPVVLGYATGTGGVANLVTKRPLLGTTRTTATLATGSWNDWRAQVDTMAPLSDTAAFRLSIERAEIGDFHRLAGGDSWDGHLALTWQPSAGMRWDLSAEAYRVNFVENPGTNRPTQALIDRGEYITGSSVQNGGTGSIFGNTFTPTGVAHIDGSQVLIGSDDFGRARAYTVQLIGSFDAGADRTITSRTLLESVSGEKYAGYTFYSYFPRSRTFEQRIEVSQHIATGALDHTFLWGGAVRGEERVSYVDFFNEGLNPFDLTLDPSTYVFPANQLFGVRPVPGRDGRNAVSGASYGVFPTTSLSQTLHSRLFNAGAFASDSIAFGPSMTLDVAARIDSMSVGSVDPLPASGHDPVSDHIVKYLPAGTASLKWKIDGATTAYLTWQRAAAVESSSGTGGFGLTANHLPDELFENASVLHEAGLKYARPDGRLNGSIAVYRQRRVRTNPRLGLPDEILVRGVEGAIDWRATDALTLGGNFTYREANYVDGPPPGSVATVPRFDPSIPSGTFGSYPAADYRLPGLPRWQANLSADWEPGGDGFGAHLWGSLQGEQNLDLFGNVVIPAQCTWNAGVSYRRGGFEVRADVLNLTDEFNWRPTSTPFAGSDLVLREPPRGWRITVRQEF